MSSEYIAGIDEAGRGPVLGPMVYSIACFPKEKRKDLEDMGLDDSKKLAPSMREALYNTLDNLRPEFQSETKVLSAEDLSTWMLQERKYNLNQISHDTAANLVTSMLNKDVNIVELYVDAVGPVATYNKKLQDLFPSIDVTVSNGADSKYKIVSAASILAKVTRDNAITNWSFKERDMDVDQGMKMGSGYPSDPNTVRWLKGNIDKVFGFPSIVRFSWGTSSNMLGSEAYNVHWEYNDKHRSKSIQRGQFHHSRKIGIATDL